MSNEEKGNKQYYRMHSNNQGLQNFTSQNQSCLFKSGILWAEQRVNAVHVNTVMNY